MQSFNMTEGKSDFNSAISVMDKMNFWFAQAEVAQADSDYIIWYKSLVNCYLLLSDDMTKDQDKKCMGFITSLNNLIVDNKNQDYTFKNYNDFVMFHKELMKVFRDAGYKTRLKEDPSQAIR